MSKSIIRHACALVAAIAMGASAAHAEVIYRVTDLGRGAGLDINNTGQVLGVSGDPTQPRLYIDTPGSSRTFLPDGFQAFIKSAAINDAGIVAGTFAFPGPAGGTRAALFDPATGVRDLGTLGEGCCAGSPPWSNAFGINNAGEVTGEASTRNGSVGFRYSPATGMVSLGVLGEEEPGFVPSSQGRDINDAGQVTGLSDLAPLVRHAFVHSPETGMVDIDTLGGSPGTVSFGFAINNAGQVTGWRFTDTDHAFRYTPGVGMAMLPTPAEWSTSHGQAINAHGVVVGRFTSTGDDLSRAFIYSDTTGAVDLNESVDPASAAGMLLWEAWGINDRGQIVGQGIRDGVTHGFLLTPVPEPETWALMLGGLVLVGAAARRRRVQAQPDLIAQDARAG